MAFTFPRQFLTLIIFCWFTMNNGFAWLMFAPVTHRLIKMYEPNISVAQVELLNSWQPLMYIVCFMPLVKLLGRRDGLRRALLLGAVLELIGAILKFLSTRMSHDMSALGMLHIGQILSAISSPVAIGAPSLLSAMWFEPSQRTRSTGAAVLFNNVGNAVSYLLVPWLTHTYGFQYVTLYECTSAAGLLCVAFLLFPHESESPYGDQPSPRSSPQSSPVTTSSSGQPEFKKALLAPTSVSGDASGASSTKGDIASFEFGEHYQSIGGEMDAIKAPNGPSDEKQHERSALLGGGKKGSTDAAAHHDHQDMHKVSAGYGTLHEHHHAGHGHSHGDLDSHHLQPPSPPGQDDVDATESTISEISLDVVEEVGKLIDVPSAVILMIVYAWSSGGYVAWTSMFDEMLDAQYGALFVGRISFCGTIGYVIGGLTVSYLTDVHFRRYMKFVILTCCMGNVVACIVFILSIPDDDGLIVLDYGANWILGTAAACGLFNGGAAPVFYELAAEITYPVDEAVSGNVLSMCENAGALLLYQVIAKVFVRASTMNYAFTTGMAITVVLCMFIKEEHKRAKATAELCASHDHGEFSPHSHEDLHLLNRNSSMTIKHVSIIKNTSFGGSVGTLGSSFGIGSSFRMTIPKKKPSKTTSPNQLVPGNHRQRASTLPIATRPPSSGVAAVDVASNAE